MRFSTSSSNCLLLLTTITKTSNFVIAITNYDYYCYYFTRSIAIILVSVCGFAETLGTLHMWRAFCKGAEVQILLFRVWGPEGFTPRVQVPNDHNILTPQKGIIVIATQIRCTQEFGTILWVIGTFGTLNSKPLNPTPLDPKPLNP